MLLVTQCFLAWRWGKGDSSCPSPASVLGMSFFLWVSDVGISQWSYISSLWQPNFALVVLCVSISSPSPSSKKINDDLGPGSFSSLPQGCKSFFCYPFSRLSGFSPVPWEQRIYCPLHTGLRIVFCRGEGSGGTLEVFHKSDCSPP